MSGVAVQAVEELAPGTAVERYEVLGLLGSGGMATVYFARHRQLGTLHALKVLAYDLPSFRQRAIQEGRAQASLRHPNVVSVNHVVTHRGVPALVMELVHGPPLDRLMYEHPLSLPEVDVLARGILGAVVTAHARGLVHRDLKPANVLVAVEDRLIPKITDFGLVKMLMMNGPVQQTQAGTIMGTPPYMSPEQLTDASRVDARTDVWALGVLLYELCTGCRPFAGESAEELLGQVLDGTFVPPEVLAPGLPARMTQAIRLALRTDRNERLATASELLSIWCGDVPDAKIAAAFGVPDVWRPETLDAARKMAPAVPSPVPRPQPPTVLNRRATSDPTMRLGHPPAPVPAPPSRRRSQSPWFVVTALAVASAVGAAALLLR